MVSNMTAGQKAGSDVTSLLRARNSLIWIVTREETRAERLIGDACAAASYPPRFWDCATGCKTLAGDEIAGFEDTNDPGSMLVKIRETPSRGAFILRDLPVHLKDPFLLRNLRSLVKTLSLAPRDAARAIVVLTPDATIPPELQGHAIVIDWPLPDRAEIAATLDARIAKLPEKDAEGNPFRSVVAPNGTRESAIDAAVGLTEAEADSTFARSLVQDRKITPSLIAAEKKRVIAREKVLEVCDPIPGGLASVAGLDLLQGWLTTRRSAFSAKARAYGLPAPRGLFMVGVPGCGKSLLAKAVATSWEMPLLRLDPGSLRSKFVGDSEANIRRALKVVETFAPCVMWIDEIEKALAGGASGAADGGVSADALGVILSWMQEHKGDVFTVATANDVSKLPPELLRKGRFDDLFFVDLPNGAERAAIVKVSLRPFSRENLPIDLEKVAAATSGFTGAEIAAIIPDAMYAAFADGEREITTEDLIRVASATVPLCKTAAGKIEELRTWAKGKARPATSPEKVGAAAGGGLDL